MQESRWKLCLFYFVFRVGFGVFLSEVEVVILSFPNPLKYFFPMTLPCSANPVHKSNTPKLSVLVIIFNLTTVKKSEKSLLSWSLSQLKQGVWEWIFFFHKDNSNSKGQLEIKKQVSDDTAMICAAKSL